MLIEHYRKFGSGILAKYNAFRYDGELIGVSNTDDITFDSLVGIEYQKQVLIDNTKAFVSGKRRITYCCSVTEVRVSRHL